MVYLVLEKDTFERRTVSLPFDEKGLQHLREMLAAQRKKINEMFRCSLRILLRVLTPHEVCGRRKMYAVFLKRDKR